MTADDPIELQDTFFGILTQDVMRSLLQMDESDTQMSRRDLIRTMFAAVEGYIWEYREHVRAVANDIDPISPIAELALSETTYIVSDAGKIDRQTRFIPLTVMIRLTTRIAEDICPGLKVDFGSNGWKSFKQAINIRNRVTHPKSKMDLAITKEDIAISQAGFFWLLGLIGDVRESTNRTSAQFLADLKSMVEKLTNGDAQTLSEYQNISKSI